MRPQHLKFMNETHFRFPADGDRPFGAGAQTGHGCAAHRGATTRRRQTVSGMGSVSKQLRCSGLLGDLVWTLSTRSGQNAGLEKEFAGQPVRFLTVASDEMDRVKKYFADKGLTLQTYVEGESAGTFDSFGIHGVPAAAIIGREGRIIGVTSGENVTAVVRKLLNGEQVELPPFQRLNNITWDQKEITWQDGVQPEFAVLIKPIEVTGGGYLYKPGSNRISGDGAMVQAMMQAAWQRATASCQPENRRSRVASSMAGSNRRSVRQKFSTSATLFQKPVARPARYAAPKAVVSMSAGRTMGQPRTSAWNCIRKLFAAAPPSTRSSEIRSPASACMASIRSRVW